MFPRRLAVVNREITNRLLRPLAGILPPFAVVEHRGRRTGRPYRTPVFAFRRPGELVIVLSYGRSSDWVKNVLAQPGAQVKRAGSTRSLVNPRVVARGECGPLSPLGRFSSRFAEHVLIVNLS